MKLGQWLYNEVTYTIKFSSYLDFNKELKFDLGAKFCETGPTANTVGSFSPRNTVMDWVRCS